MFFSDIALLKNFWCVCCW